MKQDKSVFIQGNVINLFIIYELDTWLRDLSTKSELGDCLFGALKLTKDFDPDKYGYGGYGIKFNARSQFWLNCESGENVLIFGVDNSLLLHTDNRKRYIFVPRARLINRLDDTTITAGAINILLISLNLDRKFL